MKLLLAITFGLAMALSSYSDDPKKSAAEEAIDKATADLQGTLSKLTTLDDDDKKLDQSNKAQTATTAMADKLENKILHQDAPALQERANKWDEKRQAHINSGCPAEGGTAPQPIARRCNDETDSLMEERKQILAESQALKDQAADIVKLRAAVAKTTVDNFNKQKANRAQRDDLEASKKLQEKEVDRLKGERIAKALAPIKAKAEATKVCDGIKDMEKSVCCHSVVWDNKNPTECDVPLIYTLFEKAGLFRTNVVRPGNQ
jgi:hypothetical protein